MRDGALGVERMRQHLQSVLDAVQRGIRRITRSV